MTAWSGRVVKRLYERMVKLLEEPVWRITFTSSERLLERLLASRVEGLHPPRLEEVSLYIHVPFCRRPCLFCCFVRFPLNAFDVQRYYECLRKELEHVLVESEARIYSVHVGGGTPAIEPLELAETVEAIRLYQRGFLLTVELHPKDLLDDESYAILRSLRIDRASLGVQSFNDEMLRRLGRLSHTGAEALEAARRCSRIARTVNLDLVWGIPGQTVEEALHDLQLALEDSGVNQVTLYPLLAKTRIRHPHAYEMYRRLVAKAVSRGWRPVTPWTFVRGEQLLEYIYLGAEPAFIGVGLSSITVAGNMIYANSFNLKHYCSLASRGAWTAVMATRMKPWEKVGFSLLNIVEVALAAYASLALRPRLLTETGIVSMYLAGEARRAVYTALARFRAKALAAAV